MVDFTWTQAGRSLGQGYRRLRTRTAKYWEVGRLIVLDSLWRFRSRLGVLLLISGVVLAMQAGALGLFVVYARQLESKAELVVFGRTIDPSSSYLLLLIAVCGGGVMLVASSLLRLYVDRGFFKIGSQYGVHCAERLITLTSAALHHTGRDGVSIAQAELRSVTIGGSQICSRALYGLMGMLPLTGGLVVYSAFLVYLDPLLTAVILLIVVVSFFFFYGLSLQAARLMQAREERKREMGDAYARLIDFIRYAPRPLTRQNGLVDRTLRNGAFASFFTQFFRSRIVSAQSTHVGTVTQAVVLTVVGLVKGGEIISTGTGFGELVVFLVAGRLAMSSFQGITGSLVMLNRFYPRVAAYFGTVELLERARSAGAAAASPAPGQSLKLAAKALGDNPPDRAPVINPGQRLGLVTPKLVDRFALLEVVRGLRLRKEQGQGSGGRLPPGACWLIPEAPFGGPATFAEATGLPRGIARAELARELAAIGISEPAMGSLPDDLDTPMGVAARERLDPAAFWGAAFAAAGRSRHAIIVVGFTTLEAIGAEAARNVLEQVLADRVILIACRPRHAPRLISLGARYALLYDGQSLVGYLPVEEIEAKSKLVESVAAARRESTSMPLEDELSDEM